jgi:ankyrin repeat protein
MISDLYSYSFPQAEANKSSYDFAKNITDFTSGNTNTKHKSLNDLKQAVLNGHKIPDNLEIIGVLISYYPNTRDTKENDSLCNKIESTINFLFSYTQLASRYINIHSWTLSDETTQLLNTIVLGPTDDYSDVEVNYLFLCILFQKNLLLPFLINTETINLDTEAIRSTTGNHTFSFNTVLELSTVNRNIPGMTRNLLDAGCNIVGPALHTAVKYNNIDAIHELYDSISDEVIYAFTNNLDLLGNPAIAYATANTPGYHDLPNIFNLLKNKGAIGNYVLKNEKKGSGIFVPVEPDTSVVSNARIEKFTNKLQKAIEDGNIKGIKSSIYNGADVNAFTDTGNTCFQDAIYEKNKNQQEIIKLLLRNNADVYIPDDDGYTSLVIAYNTNQYEIFKLILIHVTENNGSDSEYYSSYCGLDIYDSDGMTPIHLMVKNGDSSYLNLIYDYFSSEDIVYLLDITVDSEAEEYPGYSSLFLALYFSNWYMAKNMLNYSIDLSIGYNVDTEYINNNYNSASSYAAETAEGVLFAVGLLDEDYDDDTEEVFGDFDQDELQDVVGDMESMTI